MVSANPVYTVAHLGLIDCDAVALDVVRAINPAIYSVPRLASIDEKDPDSEHGRRRRMHRLNEELSRYYVLPEGEVEWVCSGLLSKGEHDCGQLAL